MKKKLPPKIYDCSTESLTDNDYYQISSDISLTQIDDDCDLDDYEGIDDIELAQI